MPFNFGVMVFVMLVKALVTPFSHPSFSCLHLEALRLPRVPVDAPEGTARPPTSSTRQDHFNLDGWGASGVQDHPGF